MKRQLSLLDCFGIGINGIVGSGIFFLPAVLYRTAGGKAPLAWLLIGTVCSLVALCFAEAASRTDRSGGPYRYASDAFGSYVGFAVGWITLVSALLGYTAVARGFGHAATVVLGLGAQHWLGVVLSVSMVIMLAVVNIIGVRAGARTGDVLSVIKLGSLLLFVGVGLFFVNPESINAPPSPNLALGEESGLLIAAFAGLFAVTGFEYVPVPAGEAINPQRTVPLAMVASLFGAVVLYMLVQFVAAGTNPQLGQSQAALVDSAGAFAGPLGRTLMGVLGVISTFGFCAGSALVSPRYLELFAQDGFLPRALTYRSSSHQTPVVAILVLSSIVVTLLLFPLRFESLAGISNVAVVLQYMGTCLAVMVLRHREPSKKTAGAFVVPGGPVVPVLALLGSCMFLLFVKRMELTVAACFISLGLLVGVLCRRKSGALVRMGSPVPSVSLPSENGPL